MKTNSAIKKPTKPESPSVLRRFLDNTLADVNLEAGKLRAVVQSLQNEYLLSTADRTEHLEYLIANLVDVSSALHHRTQQCITDFETIARGDNRVRG